MLSLNTMRPFEGKSNTKIMLAWPKANNIILFRVRRVTLPKLALANLVESLAIHPFKPTCDQTGTHPYKTLRVNVRKGK